MNRTHGDMSKTSRKDALSTVSPTADRVGSYEAPTLRYLGNVRSTHTCGACKRRVFSARWLDSGVLVHVEIGVDHGDIELIPELPGVAAKLPHVALTSTRRTRFTEHRCPAVKAFSGASFRGKAR